MQVKNNDVAIAEMRISRRLLIVVITNMVLCAGVPFAIAKGNSLAISLLAVCSLFVLSVTLAVPFVCSPASRPFWFGYACSAALFAILANVNKSIVYFAIRDSAIWLSGTPILKWVEPRNIVFPSVELVLRMLIPYLAGITSGAILSLLFPETGVSSNDPNAG